MSREKLIRKCQRQFAKATPNGSAVLTKAIGEDWAIYIDHHGIKELFDNKDIYSALKDNYNTGWSYVDIWQGYLLAKMGAMPSYFPENALEAA